MKFVVAVLALYGAYWYVAKHYEFHDTLVYAQKHPDSMWAQPADYYVGLVYYQRTDYAKAEEAFTQLLTDFPKGSYEESGLFYLEDSAEEARDYEVARARLQQYIDDFPNGKNIEVMRKRLELLNYHHPAAQQ